MIRWRDYCTKLGGYTMAMGSHAWMSTLDFQGAYYDRTVDTTWSGFEGPVIMLLWHEYILSPFYLRRHNDMAILLSQHRDADWLCEAARHRGFTTVRGSSTRGGSSALRELMQLTKNKSLAITPDGPRGPRRQMSPGPIYLSSKLQIPLVACGFGYDRPFRLNTWDRFALPQLYSRARGIGGPRMQVPPDLDRAGLEHYRVLVETMLNTLTQAAEDWAQSGRRCESQLALHSEPRAWWYDRERLMAQQPEVDSPVQESLPLLRKAA